MAPLVQQQFGQFPHGPIAAVLAQHQVGLAAQAPGPIGGAHQEAYGRSHRQVVEVVADKGSVLRAKIQLI
jgi:hypothetical protein